VDCNAVKASIFPYVDRELSPEARAEMAIHLTACDSCARLVEREYAFQVACRERLRPQAVPEHVRLRVAGLLSDLTARAARLPRHRLRRRLTLVGVAVGLIATGAGGTILGEGLLRARAGLTDLAEAAVDQHQRLARDLLPPDIRDVTPKDAEEWFRKRLAFNVSIPDLLNERLTFRGARISHLREVEAAALAYRVDGSDVSLFILPGEAYRRLGLSEMPRFKLITRRGYDVIVWQSHATGVGYALVSEIGGRSCLVCHSPDEVRESAASLSTHR
jgi:anti-sigma factor RsiW